MDKETRTRLEDAGFRIGDAEDFLGLTEAECLLVELRLAVSRAVRQERERLGVSQKALAARLKSSQSRVAKIEAGASDVSLDLSLRALFTLGGKLTDLIKDVPSQKRTTARKRLRRRPEKRAPIGTTP